MQQGSACKLTPCHRKTMWSLPFVTWGEHVSGAAGSAPLLPVYVYASDTSMTRSPLQSKLNPCRLTDGARLAMYTVPVTVPLGTHIGKCRSFQLVDSSPWV